MLLMEAWHRAATDAQIKAVVLTGAGTSTFCAGADLKLLLPLMSGARQPRDEFEEAVVDKPDFLTTIMQRGTEFYKPVVTAVNGAALGGGCELVVASDIRIASSEASFALSEPRFGVVPGGGSMVRLPRQLAWCHAMELMLTASPIDAERALAIGLINQIVAPDDLNAAVDSLVERIIRNAPLALQAIKRTALVTSGLGLSQAFALEDEETKKILASSDAQEGPRAFAEKRLPRFKGR